MNRWFCRVAFLCVLSGSAVAHHSFALFDQTRKITLAGTVKQFVWTNPHALIYLDVTGEQGAIDTWQLAMNSPNNLRRQGWRKDTLQAGQKVTIVLHPLRDGSKGGLFLAVTLADGTVLGDPNRAPSDGPINVPTVP
ncbi:MAG: hypothetical protein IT494_05320 [Gammaproteobacteria bacterium]|nr:hypothetical protein [Gammaproteobacteria bacterium]